MPAMDCPFRKADELVEEAKKEHRLFLLIFMRKQQVKNKRWDGILDGRVSAVVGTHTHVQTADNRILPKEQAIYVRCWDDRTL